jgi:hypothetical protein
LKISITFKDIENVTEKTSKGVPHNVTEKDIENANYI